MSAEKIDKHDRFWLMKGVTPEGTRHEQEPRWSQPPTGVLRAIEAADYPDRSEPSAGAADGHTGLDGDGGASRTDPAEEAEERCWSAAAPANDAGSDRLYGDAATDVPGGRGPDPVLRAGSLHVRADRDGMDAGLHDHPGLHGADGRGRRTAAERVRGRACGREEAGRPEHHGRGYDSAGGGDPAPERDGADGELPSIGDIGGKACGRWSEEVSGQDDRKIRGREEEAPRVPTRREEQDEGGKGSDGLGDDGDRRRDPICAGGCARSDEERCDQAAGPRYRRAEPAHSSTRRDDRSEE